MDFMLGGICENKDQVINKLLHQISHLMKIIESVSKHPYKCPVCEGDGFYGYIPVNKDSHEQRAKCHACEGKGIVWG